MYSIKNGAFALLALFTMILVTACGVGGGGEGGGGITNVANGEITGFGSVIVNGIEFTRKAGLADDRVNLRFDNISGASEERLRAGMVVTVRGTFNSTTGKGEYEAIEFQPDLRGRLDSVSEVDGTVTVMGRTVQLEANSQFDGFLDIAELQADLAGGNRPELEISGNLDSNGLLHATRISRFAANFANNGPVEIKGAISLVSAGSFTIGGVTVNTGGATFVNMTAADLAPPLLVEVKGTFDTAANTISNARIERKLAVEAEVNDNVRIKGIAAGAVGSGSFILNGPNGAITVKTASATFFKNGLAADSAIVAASAVLQVEGSLDATGAIVATKVAVEIEKTVKLLGGLSAKDDTAGTVTVNGVTVTVISVTRFVDSSSARLAPFTLADLTVNDNVQVAGYVNPAGRIIAAQVQRFDPPVDRTFIQGPVSATTADTMTILGITVTVGAATQFEGPDGTPFPGGQTVFINSIVPGVTVVKARGAFTPPGSLDATAGEVQFNQAP